MKKNNPKKLLDDLKVSNKMRPKMLKRFKKEGWRFGDFHMEKRYKKYMLTIEFCIGDFCTAIGAKGKHPWLLEKKVRNNSFLEALITIEGYKSRIDSGEHWQGEENG